MSRTYKHLPYKIKYPEFFDHSYWLRLEDGSYRDERLHDKPKKPKNQDIKWHWMTTPSWWTRATMHRPKRRQCRVWEQTICGTQDLSEADCPDWGRKPHVYYW